MIVSTVLLASKVKEGLPSTTSAFKHDKEVLTVAQAGRSFCNFREKLPMVGAVTLSWRAWKGLAFFFQWLDASLLSPPCLHSTQEWLKFLDGCLYLSLRFESILLLDSLLLLLTLIPVVVGSV